MLETPSPTTPLSPQRMHRAVLEAVNAYWNNDYETANAILTEEKRRTHPRYSMEYSMLCAVKSLVSATNETREQLLDLFKATDGLASQLRKCEASSTQMMRELQQPSDTSEEEDEAIALSAEADGAALSEHDKVRIAEIKQRAKLKRQAREEQLAEDPADAVSNQSSISGDKLWKLECDTIYADALLLRSLVQLSINSYLKGGINLRKAWGCYYALMQEIQKEGRNVPYDLQMNIKCGCGLFYCYLALVPAGLMKLLSAIGFISDKELGEQYLTEVYQSNSIRAGTAGLILCTYYLFLPTGLGNVQETLEKAKKILDLMNERYPNNTYFHAYSNFYYRKLGRAKEAVEAIVHATRNAERIGETPLLLQYLQADTLYMDLRFEAARRQYQRVIDCIVANKVTFGYTGQVLLSLAACYVWLGDEESAIATLKRVDKMHNSKSKHDMNSPKFASKVLKEPRLLPLIGVYILYINRDLAHMLESDVARLRSELDRVTAGRDLNGSLEVFGMYHLFLGVMCKGAGDRERAMAEWMLVIANEKKMSSDSIVLPYTYYEMGEVQFHLGNLEKSKELLEKGQGLRGDGHETLANRYTIALKQLKREMKRRDEEGKQR